jgi:hypothetical protein
MTSPPNHSLSPERITLVELFLGKDAALNLRNKQIVLGGVQIAYTETMDSVAKKLRNAAREVRATLGTWPKKFNPLRE